MEGKKIIRIKAEINEVEARKKKKKIKPQTWNNCKDQWNKKLVLGKGKQNW